MAINESKKMSRSREGGAGEMGSREIGEKGEGRRGRINKNNPLTPDS
jgi:hypothetical protein